MKSSARSMSFQFMIMLVLLAALFAAPVFAAEEEAYTLGPDDEIKVIVFGEDDLSGSYKIGGEGSIAMPLIGEVQIAGLTLRQTEDLMESRYAEGYLVSPSVSVSVAQYRPFYIMGEVRSPGSYSYASHMTVLNAVAMAGGFTYRANQKSVQVKKGDQEAELPVSAKVSPGDVIVVEERFF